MAGRVRPLREVLAAGLKTTRIGLGLRQEDAAARARAHGLSTWIRGTVAQAEVGARRLTLEEVLLLSLAYKTTPAALIVGEDDELVELAVQARVPAGTLRALLSGQAVATNGPPGAAAAERELDGIGDAERHAARRLGVPAEQVARAAVALWGRPLSEERDRRLADPPPDLSARRLQALRGHVTRDLMSELQPVLRGRPVVRREPTPTPSATRASGERP